jgi:hypothetical protein
MPRGTALGLTVDGWPEGGDDKPFFAFLGYFLVFVL